jgi:molecular chaperone DnaK
MNDVASPIIGIDLGTTNSLVAVYRDGRVQILEEDGEALLPSVVGVTPDNKLIVGKTARNQLAAFPDRTIASIKRRMGQAVEVQLGDQAITPQEISAIILRRLKQRAESALGTEVTRAVITVPAFFDENQRQATREAGSLAGLTVERIINEPTAASLVYHSASPERRHLLVYDLGGGTFDVSIVRVESGIVEVLSSKGDTHLGGDDFDELLAKHVAKKFLNDHGIDLFSESSTRWRLNRSCENAKCRLSFESQVRISEEYITQKDGQPIHLDVTIERHEYEELIQPLLERTIDCVGTALRDSGLVQTQIDEVVLVGGSTRTPLVQRLLRERLHREPMWSVNPDLAVALGAAVQGAMLQGANVGPVLVDVTTHTLGIAAVSMQSGVPELRFCPILRRNTPLPARYEEVYYKMNSQQEKIEIEVYQGESEILSENRFVGSFFLEDLSTNDNQSGEILVRFQLTLDGVLQVTATEKESKISKSLTINNALSRLSQQSDRDLFDSPLSSSLSFDEADFGEVIGSTEEGGFVERFEIEEESELDTSDETRRIDGAGHETKRSKLLSEARVLLPKLDNESAKDLRSLMDKIQIAQDASDTAALERLEFELDDLLFYLND